ncbi:MAG: hypothetical protein LUG47_05190, partial [Clostridiales bacterium]|nr:hypothetical protein [Clostridiales bacterium]
METVFGGIFGYSGNGIGINLWSNRCFLRYVFLRSDTLHIGLHLLNEGALRQLFWAYHFTVHNAVFGQPLPDCLWVNIREIIILRLGFCRRRHIVCKLWLWRRNLRHWLDRHLFLLKLCLFLLCQIEVCLYQRSDPLGNGVPGQRDRCTAVLFQLDTLAVMVFRAVTLIGERPAVTTNAVLLPQKGSLFSCGMRRREESINPALAASH